MILMNIIRNYKEGVLAKKNVPVYVKALGSFIIGLSFLFIKPRSSQILVCFIGSLGVVLGDVFDKRYPLKGKVFYLILEMVLTIGFFIAFIRA